MTDEQQTPDGEGVLPLHELIRARMDERGWTYGHLERQAAKRSQDGLTRSRWQQLGSGSRMNVFPDPSTLQLIADVIELDITTVLIAAAQSLGLDARRRGPMLAHLLPAGTDVLSDRMRDAILTIIRAAVAEQLAMRDEGDGERNDMDMRLEWARSSSSSHLRNATADGPDNPA